MTITQLISATVPLSAHPSEVIAEPGHNIYIPLHSPYCIFNSQHTKFP